MKKLYITFIALFLAAIIFPALFVFFGRDSSFSDNENRALQTAPKLSAQAILAGDFQESLTAWISDQFPARDSFTSLAAQIKKASGIRDIGGAYIGADGYYFEKKTQNDINSEKLARNLSYINDFASKKPDIRTTVLLVPAAGAVMCDKLPQGARMYDARAFYESAAGQLSNCTVPDLYSAFVSAGGDGLYYRTDHHWTYSGAYLAYRTYMGEAAAYSGASELFCENFRGTTYSKTLDPAAPYDSVYLPVLPDGVSVTADGMQTELYDRAALGEKDKYKVFFGGNFGQTIITGGVQNGKTLLVIKDSFANSLVPCLTWDYETIIMLDLRYYNASVQSITESANVTDILFVGEMGNIAADDNLYKLGF